MKVNEKLRGRIIKVVPIQPGDDPFKPWIMTGGYSIVECRWNDPKRPPVQYRMVDGSVTNIPVEHRKVGTEIEMVWVHQGGYRGPVFNRVFPARKKGEEK